MPEHTSSYLVYAKLKVLLEPLIANVNVSFIILCPGFLMINYFIYINMDLENTKAWQNSHR